MCDPLRGAAARGDKRDMEESTYELEGTVVSVIYRNPENGYAVVKLETLTGGATAVGTIPMAVPGEQAAHAGALGHARVLRRAIQSRICRALHAIRRGRHLFISRLGRNPRIGEKTGPPDGRPLRGQHASCH